MKVTFIGHASILVEANGVSILSDPWWTGPCFGAQWWLYPGAYLQPLESREPDYIYISHGHHDHFHPGTLARFSRSVTVLVAAGIGLKAPVEKLGFRVTEVARNEELPLGNNLRCRIIRTVGGDTLMAIADGREVCLNLNDSLHPVASATQDRFVSELRRLYPEIMYVFCGYGTASYFPNCIHVPGKDDVQSAIMRQKHFNRSWCRLIDGLGPVFGFPFAADVIFLERDLSWVNEVVHNSERPTDVFTQQEHAAKIQVIDIAPGFSIQDGEVASNIVRKPVRVGEVISAMGDRLDQANKYPAVDVAAVDEVVELIRANIEQERNQVALLPRDCRFLIKFRNSSLGIAIVRSANKVSVARVDYTGSVKESDLTYTTRLNYLKNSLTNKYGSEVLLVGSGGIFEYRKASDIKCRLHEQLIAAIKPSRRGGMIADAKKFARRLLRYQSRQNPMYDLEKWAVFKKESSTTAA